ncbi:hypothetical protein [Prevotella sp. 10(H)]|uniref:hypothetical protein n=1 Tax=Prevotella sp. 10(H) TaxID=1158294 RepID=UPI0004A6DD51|nr:hypothetical protein [Prevotella sp. 10(H)]
MDKAQLIHEKILDFLIKENKKNPEFYFGTRQRNNNERLEKGYWFQGDDGYVYVSFWIGGDSDTRRRNIGFAVNCYDKNSRIILTAKADIKKAEFLKIVADKLGFYNGEYNGIYYKDFEGKDYIENFKSFIRNEKVEIDKLIEEYKPKGISIIRESDFNKKYKPIIERRISQIEFGRKNKIARLCWNTNGWKCPSGTKGKSLNSYSYENKYGFGHEEWLFDKSKTLDGYHYAFIEAFNIKDNKHVGKEFNIKLYSIDAINNTKYYIGEIKNLIGVSKEDSEDIYKAYLEREWLNEMITQVKSIGGKWSSTIAKDAKILFNVKFRFEDAHILEREDYEVIAASDINITSTHFVLLPQKNELEIEYYIEKDDEFEGNDKNTEPRKRTLSIDITFDPVHDKIQNELRALLNKSTEYNLVQMERGRVDLKARTTENKWHYFEIKTDSAKLSIRKAIGQIMEYAYYPEEKRATKLIIVSEDKPTNDDITYLKFVRENFSIPVYYRYFDREKQYLSEDY